MVTVLPEWVQPIPSALSFETCAAIPVNYATAWIMLVRQGNLKPGETVLVHSAGGGVGLAALQIIKHFGGRAIGTASQGKHARLKEMGYEHCIDYRTEDFEAAVMDYTKGRGVDIVLDAQGGKSFQKSYQCLAPLGRLFLFGAASFAPGKKMNIFVVLKGLLSMPKWSTLDLLDKNRGVFGTNMGHLWDQMKDLQSDFEQIMALAADGTFQPVVDSVFSFEDAAKAHDYIQDRKNFGKVLLKP